MPKLIGALMLGEGAVVKVAGHDRCVSTHMRPSSILERRETRAISSGSKARAERSTKPQRWPLNSVNRIKLAKITITIRVSPKCRYLRSPFPMKSVPESLAPSAPS